MPTANQSGSATITVTVSDGTLSASETFVLTVQAVNDAPVVVTNVGLIVGEGATGTVGTTQLKVTDVEQARGEEVDFRTDIYSLGATLFHMLTGQPPFRGESVMIVLRKHESEELPPLNTLPPSFSPSVYQLMNRMMAKRREQRFESYDRLLEALENC
jgi:serine/threonine protein kinase